MNWFLLRKESTTSLFTPVKSPRQVLYIAHFFFFELFTNLFPRTTVRRSVQVPYCSLPVESPYPRERIIIIVTFDVGASNDRRPLQKARNFLTSSCYGMTSAERAGNLHGNCKEVHMLCAGFAFWSVRWRRSRWDSRTSPSRECYLLWFTGFH